MPTINEALLKKQYGVWVKICNIEVPAIRHDFKEYTLFMITSDTLTDNELNVIQQAYDFTDTYLMIKTDTPDDICTSVDINEQFRMKLKHNFLNVRFGKDATIIASKSWWRKVVLQHDGDCKISYEPIPDTTFRFAPILFELKYGEFKVVVLDDNRMIDGMMAMNNNSGDMSRGSIWLEDEIIQVG